MECIFCQIVNKKIPADIVYETDKIIAFRDINPKAPVHDLVIPKKHIGSLNEISFDDRDIIFELLSSIKIIAKEEGIAKRGYRVIVNTGRHGGQLVEHLHFHLLGGKNLGHKIVF